MTHFIIAIDPGNHTGITYGVIGGNPTTALFDFTPKSATKKRKADEKHQRYGELWKIVMGLVQSHSGNDGGHEPYEVIKIWQDTGVMPFTQNFSITIICEGAAGFTKGKSAVEVSNKYRGVVECIAAVTQSNYIGIQPNDLQRWATGKGRAEKSEMIKVASDRYGFTGTDDNCADSLLLWHFAKEQLQK